MQGTNVLEAGLALSQALKESGANVYLGVLPDIPGKEKTGADDFIVQSGAFPFRRWVDSLKPFIYPELYRLDTLLYEIPSDTPKEQIPFALRPLVQKLSQLEKGLGEQYLGTKVKNYFNLTNKNLDNLAKLLKDLRKQSSKTSKQSRTKQGLSPISFYKNEEYIIELIYIQGKAKFLVYSLSSAEISETQRIEIDNEVYLPVQAESIEKRTVVLPSGVEEYGTESDLLVEVQRFIHRYVELGKEYELIASYYVLFSWIYDCFPELPYLRFQGDWGTGKSRAIVVIGSLCYKPIFTFGATSISPIFRLLELFRGTLIIDEGDHQNSDTWQDFVKVLNVGFQRHFPLLRTEEVNGQREPKSFYVFGPKVLSTRFAFKDHALESRCLTKVMPPNSRRPEIPINLPDDFYDEVDRLQRKLLLFRLRNHSRVGLNPAVYDPNLEDRYNQILIPLLSIISDEAVKGQIKALVLELQDRAVEARSESLEGKLYHKGF